MKTLLTTAFVICLPLAVWASQADTYIEQLAGNDELARCEARQMLPRESIDVVPKLLPLLAHEDAAVWNAAFVVLADFANEVSAPGRPDDQRKVADVLMKLVEPEQPLVVKERGLKLLTIVVPKDHPIKPITALLDDPDLSERAREALQEIASPEACAALRRAVEKADPEFQCALLDSLGQLRDEKSLPLSAKLAAANDSRVRASAARALAWTGNASYIKLIESVVSAADAATAFDANDALARLADAMAATDHAPEAVALYKNFLGSGQTIFKGAGIVGLVKFGGETAAGDIVAALAGPGGSELEPMAFEAFEHARGAAPAQCLLAVYPKVPAPLQASLIAIMGRKGDVAFLDALKQAVDSAEPGFCAAALKALADSQLPEAVPVLVAAVRKKSGDEKAGATANLKQLAELLKYKGAKQAAGEAYLGLYTGADSDDARQQALRGIIAFPTVESADVVMKAVASGEIKEGGSITLAFLAKSLTEAGRKDEAGHAVDLIFARIRTTDDAKNAIAASQSVGGIPNANHRLGFVTKWRVAGPFPWIQTDGFKKVNVNEPAVDVKARYHVGNEDITWDEATTKDDAGVIDLAVEIGNEANVVGYAITTIDVPEAADATARMGSDDGIKLWVNNGAVHENNVNRGNQMDQDQVPIKLKQGENTLLVEVTQGGGGWNFSLRLTKPDGAPLEFKQ